MTPSLPDALLPAPSPHAARSDGPEGAGGSASRRVLMGIAGGTGSGKTTVAEAIIRQLSSEDVIIISQDNYYRDRAELPLEERAKINYDHPDAFDWPLLLDHLHALRDGHGAEGPLYDFATHTRRRETVFLRPAKVIFLEGIMTLVDPRVRSLLDIKIFVHTDSDVRFIRRLERDVRERGRTLDSVISQYLNIVRPMHRQFVEPSRHYADLIVPEGGFNRVAVDLIVTKVRAILAAERARDESPASP